MKRCYNSGKITGLSFYSFHMNFYVADRLIRALGYNPINPVLQGIQGNAPWWLHMAVDITLLLTCRTAYFQKNWKDSKGARIEHKIAKLFKLKIIYQA